MAEATEQLTGVSKTLADYLGMTTRPVGVKVYREGEAVETPSPDRKKEKLRFCRFVREAAAGRDFLIRMEDLDCANAEVALGFREPKYVKIEPRIKDKIALLKVGAAEDCDVVLLLLNPEQVMTLSILLEGVNARFKGDMAVCGEAMAQVYNTGQPNVTFLCGGARTFGGYQTNDVIMALPYKTFTDLPSRMTRFSSLGKKARDGLTQLLLRIKK